MAARVLDGKAVAARVRERVADEVADLEGRLGRPLGLATVLTGDDPASQVYVRNKRQASADVGIRSIHHDLPADIGEEGLLGVLDDLNADPGVDGVLVQLPLPDGIDQDAVVDRIAPAKDVDGLTAASAGLLAQGRQRLVPCTPAGVMELLAEAGVRVEGAEAVIVGRSILVGRPLAALLLNASATVTVCHSRTRDLAAVTREADVLVAAIGRAGFVRAEHVKPGAVVVDVGMNRVEDASEAADLLLPERRPEFTQKGYALVGDVHAPSVSEVASALTPVPGGVGPLTIAMLMSNTVKAAALRG